MTGIPEPKEWTNIWWDEADKDEGLPRIFLAGDSMLYGYHGPVINKMANEARITSYATSKCIDNPHYTDEFDLVYSQYGFKYKIIHINNGLHGVHLSKEDYERCFDAFIKHCLEVHPEAKLCLCLCTPCFEGENFEREHHQLYPLALERNEVIMKLAEKYGLAVDDLFTPLKDHPELHVPDGIHYKPEGVDLQAEVVSKFLREQIKGLK